MLFNSLEFCLFLVVVFALFWFAFQKALKVQNGLIIVSSYLFYGWWDWRFLFLIVFSSLTDYFIGLKLEKTEQRKLRKLLLFLSVSLNLGLLGFFKYYNFFSENFSLAFSQIGINLSPFTLDIILPVGISFYTFQTMSYTIDIYHRKLSATKDLLAFLSFVSFFPQLVAGPIERASHLLPQFLKERKFDYHFAVSGIRIIIWGLFKKMVIADNASIIVDGIFNDYSNQTSASLAIGMIFFAFQIYGDFSGYSDIAIGVSRLFGFDLMTNFRFPYLSKNISEFWKRWHISLSSWFRDYLYIPLGGSKGGKWNALINVMIVFLVSGFWHGANWTFIVWGAINGLMYLPLFIQGKNKDQNFSTFSLKDSAYILLTFVITCSAWVYFRSDSVADANRFLWTFVTGEGNLSYPISSSKHILTTAIVGLSILILVITEVNFSKKKIENITLSNGKLVLLILFILFTSAFQNPVSL